MLDKLLSATKITNNFVVCTNSSGNRLNFGRKNLQRNVMEQKGLQTRKSSSRVFDFSIQLFRETLSEKSKNCTSQSRKVFWDTVNEF